MIAMSDLISRDEITTEIEKINCVDYGSLDSYEAHSAVRYCLLDIQRLIDDAPTVDAIPVVHCKDCRFLGIKGLGDGYCRKKMTGNISPYDFCSYGEKR